MANFLDDIKIRGRSSKPRTVGLTLMSDGGSVIGGLGRSAAKDLLEVAHPFIDGAKIRMGLNFLFPQEWIVDRIALYKQYGVIPYPGGILFEVAYLQDKYAEMLKGCVQLGYEAIEISENFVTLEPQQRESLAKRAQDAGLKVIFEWGRKYPEHELVVSEAIDEIHQMIDFGVWRVVLERAEIDLLKDKHPEHVKQIVESVGMEHMILEGGPGKFPEYPVWLIKLFGNEVSISNLLPIEVIRVEEYRRGLDRQVGYDFVQEGAKV